MRRALVALAVLLALPLVARADGEGNDAKVLKFDTMAAVVAPFLGAAGTIDGVPAGGAPWRIASGRGELRADGRIKVRVRGLVLVGTGQNPFTSFAAFVGCLGGTAVQTAAFPTGPEGDADIEDTVALPSPCFAPVVLVGIPRTPARPAGAWFASTGR
ncbi:MAG TPA: hypothetical protein VFP65_15675 [Anaeromyxobacteraceae bacterium]|nr:hypothetical protein [Anaeromyxobacteraceae bacterium]